MDTVKLPFYARLAFVLLALVLTFIILKAASNIFIPLVFGLLISILLYPLQKLLQNKLHFGKTLSALAAVLLFISVLAVFTYFLALQVSNFSQDFPQLSSRFQQIFDELQHWITNRLHINDTQQADYINRSINGILGLVGASVSNIFISLTSTFVLMIFVFIFAFFMLYSRKLLIQFVLHLFPTEHRDKVSEVIIETKSLINGYILGLLTEMLLVGIVSCTMFLIMGIKYALLLGAMAAILNIIPYLGFYTSIAITMIVTLANSTPRLALEAGIGMLILHIIDANILVPRIVGARVKMNPFITIIAVIVGEFLWGIPGMFLFIPITGIIKLICDRVEGLEAWGLLIGMEEPEPPKRKIPKEALKK